MVRKYRYYFFIYVLEIWIWKIVWENKTFVWDCFREIKLVKNISGRGCVYSVFRFLYRRTSRRDGDMVLEGNELV